MNIRRIREAGDIIREVDVAVGDTRREVEISREDNTLQGVIETHNMIPILKEEEIVNITHIREGKDRLNPIKRKTKLTPTQENNTTTERTKIMRVQ